MRIEAGHVAAITGGASGIGLALARRLGAMGVKLALADVERPALDRAVQELEHAGLDVIGVRTDISQANDVQYFRDAVLDRYGQVDILVNNAGVVSPFRPLWQATLAEWDWVLGVNLRGVVHGIHFFAPLLVTQGHGHVVNTASMAGLMVVPSNGPYNASKHAVVSMSETLRADLEQAGIGVGVTVVCPGLVDTNIDSAARNAPMSVRQSLDLASEKPMASAQATLDADEIARQIIAAVERDQLYLVTHAGASEPIRTRIDRLMEEMATPL